MIEVHAFGEVLQDLRRQKGFTQQQLADASECTRPYISLLESGKHNPTLTLLLQISRALGMTASGLVASVEERLCEIHKGK